jgi:SAM-dependent methyltransferase
MRLRTATLLLAALLGSMLLVGTFTTRFGDAFADPFLGALSVLVAVFLATTAWSAFSGAPFVPTDARNVATMIRIAGIREGEKVADLGSGDGRILIAAAKAGARAEGWEISPYLWLLSLWNIRRAGVADRVRVHLGSYWDHAMTDADVVTLFLIGRKMPDMKTKLAAELPKGARVVSYAFPFPQWPIAAMGPNGVHLYHIDDIR